MAVAPTYPGVYIEEVSSGVRTLTGVATSITAFIGYTSRGKVNEPVTIHSYADFEREFGGLAVDSPLSYCVKHFFQNGGSDAIVVRVAAGAAAASVTIKNSALSADVLTLTAASEGTWGNNLRVDVDYDTINPANLFNLTVSEVGMQNGEAVIVRSDPVFRNLTMNDQSPTYAVAVINSGSQLVRASLPSTPSWVAGMSESSGFVTAAGSDSFDVSVGASRLYIAIDGGMPFPIDLPLTTSSIPVEQDELDDIADIIANAINSAVSPGKKVKSVHKAGRIVIQREDPGAASSVQILVAPSDASSTLRLGLANGGTETDGAAGVRPHQTGTVCVDPVEPTSLQKSLTITIFRANVSLDVFTFDPWLTLPVTLEGVRAKVNDAMVARAASSKLWVGAVAQLFGGTLRILPGFADANLRFELTGSAVDDTTGLNLAGSMSPGLARYSLGEGTSGYGQTISVPGSSGSPPGWGDIKGSPLEKTGINALEKVDLFNLLVIPEACTGTGKMNDVLVDAITYCTRRRAMMLIDAPPDKAKLSDLKLWLAAADTLRSRNSAIFYPRITAPDPMNNGRIREFPAAGAVAGLCARTDAERGVWKAPAGTSATIIGATGLQVSLTDSEQGDLNPLALNCLRTFPVIGTVNWGARTGKGADKLTDEYKYIPVRRLALFLEESLYRGTQWVVFEPNDEPLWAQIRLNLGAFMHNLFSQGAFQGSTPRQAYFVKCDKETTTQNDIDLGRVNIRVGFAPLKPAEFVIIQIQQIAGAIVT